MNPPLAGKTQIVIDGTVVLKEGAEFTCGPKTDIVFVEKDGIKALTKRLHDASAIVLDGGSRWQGPSCGATVITLARCNRHQDCWPFSFEDAEGDAYVLNRRNTNCLQKRIN